jgi:hypothetical protein
MDNKLSLKGCWKYWIKNFQEAKEWYETYLTVISLLLAGFIFFANRAGLNIPAISTSVRAAIELLAACYSGWILFLWLPYKREALLTKRLSTPDSPLEIEAIPIEITGGDIICQIAVRNRGVKTVYDAGIELTAVESEMKQYVELPKQLPLNGRNNPGKLTADPYRGEIHSGERLVFDAFVAGRNMMANPDKTYNVYVRFTLPGDPSQLEGIFHKMNQSYRLTFTVTGRDVPAKKEDWDLVFSGVESICQFTLTKSINIFDAQKI